LAPGLVRYRWELRQDGRVIEKTKTHEQFLRVSFPGDGAYEIEVRAADHSGSASEPAVSSIEAELPR
jgi:hypothetical protein